MVTKKVCKSCGAISFNKEDICPICNIPLITVSFFTGRKIDNLGGEDRNKYIEEITGQKLDPIMIQKRKDYLKKSYEEQKEILQKRIRKSEEAKINEYQQKYLAEHNIECPYCHSTNTKKISIGSKVTHTALFGVFSIGKNSKQWHCNSCKSDF